MSFQTLCVYFIWIYHLLHQNDKVCLHIQSQTQSNTSSLSEKTQQRNCR